MMNQRVNVLGTYFNNVTRAEAVKQIVECLQSASKASVFTPNPEIVMEAYNNSKYQQVLNRSEMTIPDGIGVVIGAKMIGHPLKERTAGFDTIQDVFATIEGTGLKVFFLGAGPGVAEIAKEKMVEKFPKLNIVGCHDGYFKDDQKVIDYVNSCKPDLLLVGLGFPRQEFWIDQHREALTASVLVGCGGSLDAMSGKVKRAPEFFIRLNLEWFYRLISQPTRAKRMLKLPLFLLKVIFEGRKYGQEQ